MAKEPCKSCGSPDHHAKGYCHQCYVRLKRNGTPMPKQTMNTRTCLFDNCTNKARLKNYCPMHAQWLARNDPAKVGLDPNTCQRTLCDAPRFRSGLCAEHYKGQAEGYNEKRRLHRESRAKAQEDKKKSVRPGYADVENIKHLVDNKPIPDDYWEFVKYELGLK